MYHTVHIKVKDNLSLSLVTTRGQPACLQILLCPFPSRRTGVTARIAVLTFTWGVGIQTRILTLSRQALWLPKLSPGLL